MILWNSYVQKHFFARVIERNTCLIFTEGLHAWRICGLNFIPIWLQPGDDWYEHIISQILGIFFSLKFLLWAIYLHSQPSWAIFSSNSPSQEQSSSFSTGSFIALGSCFFLSRLVTTCSNSMKSPIRIPHTTPWQNSSEAVIFVEDREDWQNVISSLHRLGSFWCANRVGLQTKSEGRTLIGCHCFYWDPGVTTLAVSGKEFMRYCFADRIGKKFYTCVLPKMACSYASPWRPCACMA